MAHGTVPTTATANAYAPPNCRRDHTLPPVTGST